jgi:hypothetical protein
VKDDERQEVEVARQMVPEAKRLRFIENELRARRYKLLSAIKIYEGDLRSWRDHEALCVDTRKAVPMRRRDSVSAFFRMPPTRPSYLPPAHCSRSEGVRAVRPCLQCPKWCPGLRGDKEILQWRVLLKASPEAERLTEISLSSPKDEKKSRLSKSSADVERFDISVGEDDLQRYGIDPTGLPGLFGGRFEEL